MMPQKPQLSEVALFLRADACCYNDYGLCLQSKKSIVGGGH